VPAPAAVRAAAFEVLAGIPGTCTLGPVKEQHRVVLEAQWTGEQPKAPGQ
jgi:hypothetical protein